MKSKGLIIRLAIIVFMVFSAVYVVDETEQVLVTKFANPVGESKRAPGLSFSIPIVQ